MTRRLCFAFVVLGFIVTPLSLADTTSTITGDDSGVWEPDISAYEIADRVNPPPQGAVLFVGSSSIRLWRTLADDMTPMKTINRGFGGAELQDLLRYADRVVIPYQPKAIVLFAGTNDISGSNPRSPSMLFATYLGLVKVIQAELPDTPIYYIGITPTRARWQLWSLAQDANKLIGDYTKSDHRLRYIDTSPGLLDRNGEPNAELFQPDGLHLNRQGYATWTSIIKPRLTQDLNPR